MNKIEEITNQILASDDKRVEIIILIIDNGREAAKECISRILEKVRYPFKLTVYENSVNSTLGSCNTARVWNKLIKESTCGYVCIMDDDSVPNNDFITEMVRVLEKHPEAAAVAPAGDDDSYVNPNHKGHRPDEEEFELYDDMSGFCFMFRRSLMETDDGWFDESFPFYGQDSEWTYRFSLTEKIFYIVPRARVNHKTSVASTKTEREGRFNKQEDIKYAQNILKEYRNANLAKWNPFRPKRLYNIRY